VQLHENLQGQIQDFLRGAGLHVKKKQQQQQYAIIFVMKND